MNSPFECFNRKSIETILPHRGAALRKIDGVLISSDNPEVMLGLKEVNSDDPDLEGHFPGAPTYPGYAQDEFVCLVAAALLLRKPGFTRNPHVVQKTVRYRANVVPGDRLVAEVRLVSQRSKFSVFSGIVRNQKSEIVAEYERIVGAA